MGKRFDDQQEEYAADIRRVVLYGVYMPLISLLGA